MLSPSHPIRFALAMQYRKARRQWQDLCESRSFCLQRSDEVLQNLVKSHSSPLMRRLQNVDPQLQANKKQNLLLVCRQLDGVIIGPGEIFSFWRWVGKPLAKRGYVEGMVIKNGHAARGIGGGLCQFSNALFWLSLHSHLEVIERHRHSFDLFPDDRRSVPFGLGATVSHGIKDLRFFNPSDCSYQIRCRVTDDDLHVELRIDQAQMVRFEVYETGGGYYQRPSGMVFRRNEVFRKNSRTGAEVLLYKNDYECRYHVPFHLLDSRTPIFSSGDLGC